MAPRLRAPQPAHLSSLLPVASLDREIAIVNFWIKLACSYCSRTNWWLVTGDTSGSLCSPNARLATSKKIRRKTWATLLHSFGMLFRSLFETLLTHLACCFWQLPKTTAESHKFIPLPWNSCSPTEHSLSCCSLAVSFILAGCAGSRFGILELPFVLVGFPVFPKEGWLKRLKMEAHIIPYIS